MDLVNVDGRIKILQDDLEKKQNQKFTTWMNDVLKQDNLRVVDLCEDLQDGVKLSRLLEVLTNEEMGRTKGSTKLHRIDNVNRCLNALRRRKIRIEGISAEQIVTGSSKDIIALVTAIYQSHQTGKLGNNKRQSEDSGKTLGDDEDRQHKEALLAWCKEKTKGYRGVDLKDFSRSWRDGLALNALIHSQRPDLVDYESLKKEDGRRNLTKAFEILETNFWIMKIIRVEDVDKEEPNEKDILAYVALIFESFFKNGSNETESRKQAPQTTPKPSAAATQKSKTVNGSYSANGPQRLVLSSTSISPPPRSMVIKVESRKKEVGGSASADYRPKVPSTPPPLPPTVQAIVFEGSWECDYCAFANSPSTRICAMCYKAKVEKKEQVKRVVEKQRQELNAQNGKSEEEQDVRGKAALATDSEERSEDSDSHEEEVKEQINDEADAAEEPSPVARTLRLLDETFDGPCWECPGCHHRNPNTTSICGFCFRTLRQLKALSLEEMGFAGMTNPPAGKTEDTL